MAKDRLNQAYPRLLLIQEKEEAVRTDVAFRTSPAVRVESLCLYTRQMAAMINGGIAINRAVRFVARGDDKRLNQVMNGVADAVEGGKSLSQALATQPRVFNDTYVALVRAGETAGNLDVSLNRLSTLLEKTVALKKRVQSTFAYPCVIGVVAMGIVALFVFYIVPMLLPMFDSVGIELPWPTRMLILFSTTLSDPRIAVPLALLVVGGFSGLVFLYNETERAPGFRTWIDQTVLKLPIVGELVELSTAARVLYTMSTMLAAGVMLVEVIKTCETVAGNRVMARKLRDTKDALLSGVGLYDSMSMYEVFAPTALQMIKVGEETGRLDDLVQRVGKMYEDDVDLQLDNLASMIEPIIMAFMGVIVGFVVIASFLPMIQLIQQL